MYCMYLHVFVCIMHVSCMYNYSEYAFYEVDTGGYRNDMKINVFVCIRYKFICTACICMYPRVHICMYTMYICMYCIYPCIISWYMHVLLSSQTSWRALTHECCDWFKQTLKLVWKTHRFKTSQRLAFYCFNAPPPGSLSAISWPMNWCSTGGCLTPAALQGRTFPWESGYRCSGTCDVPQSPAGRRGKRPRMWESGTMYTTGSGAGIYRILVPICAVLGHHTLPSLGQ